MLNLIQPLNSRAKPLTRTCRGYLVFLTATVLISLGCGSVDSYVAKSDGRHMVRGPFIILDEDFPLDRDFFQLQDVRSEPFDTYVVIDRRPFLERDSREFSWYGQDATRLDHAHFLPAPIYLLDQHFRSLTTDPGGVWVERFDIINVHPVATQEAREGISAQYGFLVGVFNSIYGGLRAVFRLSDEESGEVDQAEDYFVCDVRLRYRGETVALRNTRHYLTPGQSRDVFHDEQARFQLRALVQICIAESVTEWVLHARRKSSFVTAAALRF